MIYWIALSAEGADVIRGARSIPRKWARALK